MAAAITTPPARPGVGKVLFIMSHTVEILSVGTELLLGNIVNTDAQMLSQGLSALGLNVYYHTVVGDNPQRVRRAVDIARQRADIIITTGGLGPTCDDLTKNVLAQAFGKKLVYDEESARRIRSHFVRTGRPITENIFQQAMLPEGCTIFSNDWGVPFRRRESTLSCSPAPPASAAPCSDIGLRPISGSCPRGSSSPTPSSSSASARRPWRPG